MKKTTLALACAFGVASAFAQDLTSKKGEPILPEAGDWAIGVDATPFLKYAGGFLSSGGATAPTADFLNSTNTIIGKMFKDEKTAYRAIVRIGFNNQHATAQIADGSSTATLTFPALPAMKEDKASWSSNFIGLGAGMEMRRGKTRLQGYYGAEAMLWLTSSSKKFTYGNALAPTATPAVTVANSTDWSSTAYGANLTTDTYGGAARITSWKSGSTFGFGVRGFIGAEYFIFPKISLAGEFGWGLGISTTGASTTTTESIGGSGPAAGTQEIKGNKSGSFYIDTDQSRFGTGTGTLRLNLHF